MTSHNVIGDGAKLKKRPLTDDFWQNRRVFDAVRTRGKVVTTVLPDRAT